MRAGRSNLLQLFAANQKKVKSPAQSPTDTGAESEEQDGGSPTREILEQYRLAAEKKRKDPIYNLKSLALIEEKHPYEYEELEESLINFLLIQVVVMREKPFYEATSLLEKSIHMNKIMDMIGKL